MTPLQVNGLAEGGWRYDSPLIATQAGGLADVFVVFRRLKR